MSLGVPVLCEFDSCMYEALRSTSGSSPSHGATDPCKLFPACTMSDPLASPAVVDDDDDVDSDRPAALIDAGASSAAPPAAPLAAAVQRVT